MYVGAQCEQHQPAAGNEGPLAGRPVDAGVEGPRQQPNSPVAPTWSYRFVHRKFLATAMARPDRRILSGPFLPPPSSARYQSAGRTGRPAPATERRVLARLDLMRRGTTRRVHRERHVPIPSRYVGYKRLASKRQPGRFLRAMGAHHTFFFFSLREDGGGVV